MNFFAVNIVTDTKTGDAFDAVALNKMPVIYTGDSADELFESKEFIDFAHNLLKAESLFEKAKVYVRWIGADRLLNEEVFNLPEKMKW